MIDYIISWIVGNSANVDSYQVFRFAALPIVISIYTLGVSAFWSIFAALFGIAFRGRNK